MAAAAVVLVAACGSQNGAQKKPARDCDSYAKKVADLSDPAPGKRDGLVAHSVERCEAGRIPDAELTCVAGAKNRAELIECTTGAPPMDSSPPPPAAKGTNKVTLLTAVNGEGFHPLDLALNEDQRTWFEGLKKDIAACATDEVYDPPKQYVVVVTFSSEAPAISLGGLPAPLSFCVKQVLQRRQPNSVGVGPAEFYIDVGR
ncbi:MAG TPA: hypothetical protein VFV99_26395 [Kofleriaceae bacterium]|nr:hypothetical protein [Kofleriaceae bacterium]